MSPLHLIVYGVLALAGGYCALLWGYYLLAGWSHARPWSRGERLALYREDASHVGRKHRVVAPNAWTLGLGRHWIMIPSFEFGRTQVTESRVPPLAIVKALDVFEDFAAGLSSGVPLTLVRQFDLNGGEEALRYRVVPAVSLATHATADSVLCQHCLSAIVSRQRWWRTQEGIDVVDRHHVKGRRIVETARTTKESEARKLLKIRIGHVANDRPVGPVVGRTMLADLAAMVEADYKANYDGAWGAFRMRRFICEPSPEASVPGANC